MWKDIPEYFHGGLLIISTCNPSKNRDCCVKSFSKEKSFSDERWNIEHENTVNLFCDHIKHQERINRQYMDMGYTYTDIVLQDHRDLNEINYNKQIDYGYCVSLIHWSGHVYHTKCLRTNPKWMQEHRDHVGPLNIHHLMIPGTHNSGTYWPVHIHHINRISMTQVSLYKKRLIVKI